MRFRYLKDPLFIFCVVLYFLNRWILKPYFPNTFSRDYLNDVICIPFWLPIMLFVMKVTRLRNHDGPPTASEILVPLIVWSWVFEAYLPFTKFFKHIETSDYMDIFSYTVGSFLATVFWKFWYREWHFPKLNQPSISFRPEQALRIPLGSETENNADKQ